MRRSKSSSNIPIPKRSTARTSSEENLNLLKYTTPLRSYQGTSRLGSASSGRPPYSSSRKAPPSTGCSRERKSIQALSTDRKWVDQQHEKVCRFIEESKLFQDKSISNNVKPLTLKSFVYIMNILLGEIFSNIEITTDNYKEIIQQKFKVLRYPGTISISTLKCVNVPHTFPQAIAMIGWVVDKVSLQLNAKSGHIDYLSTAIKSKTSQITFEYFLKRYVTYNDAPETDTADVDKEYGENIREVLNIDENKLQEHENRIKKNKEIIRDQDNEIKALKNTISEIKSKTEGLQDEIKQFEKNDPNEENSVDAEIEHTKHCIKAIDDSSIKVQENIKSLEELIRQQPYSKQDKLELLNKIDSLSERIRTEKEKINHFNKIKQEFTLKSDVVKEKVKEAVKQWNNSLLKWTIYKPELKQLSLEEKFEEDSFLDEVKEVQEKKASIDKQLQCEKQKIDDLLHKQKLWKREMETEISSTEETLKQLEDKLKELETENDALTANLKQNDAEMKRTEKNLLQEILKLKQECAEQEENHNRMTSEIAKQGENLQATIIKTVSYFTSVYNEIITTWRKISEMHSDVRKFSLEQEKTLQDVIFDAVRKLEEISVHNF